MTRFRGLVWRHVPPGAEPLHLGWILNATRGRWNTRRPRLPCIYTALTPEGAVAEYERHVALFGLRGERDLVSIRLDVDDVLDLTSELQRRRCRIPLHAIAGDEPRDLAACRRLAVRAVFRDGYGAILAPSAALPEGVNLMVYELRTDHIRTLLNGPDRTRIVPGRGWPPPPPPG